MEWSTDRIIEFLEIYEKERCLWYPTHPLTKNRHEVANAWLRIKNAMSVEFTVEQLRKKRDSLMGSFRGQMHKKKRFVMTTVGKRGEPYKSSWFAFATMDRFLGEFYLQEVDVQAAQESKDEQNQEDVEYLIDIKPNNLSRSNSTDSEAESSTCEKRCLQTPVVAPALTRNNIPPPNQINVKNTPELIAAVVGKKRMNESYDFLKVVPEKSEMLVQQRDECELFGELLVKRLKKLDESLRDDVMNEIDNLVYRAGTKSRKK